jgi:DNA modification methylase
MSAVAFAQFLNDSMSAVAFAQFLNDSMSAVASGLYPGAAIYVAHSDSWGHLFRNAYLAAGLLLKECLIWAKDAFVMGRQDYHWQHEPILYGFKEAVKLEENIAEDADWQHEPILYGWKPGAAHSWYSNRRQSTILSFARPKRSTVHPTMKPVALVEYCIRNSSKLDDVVLDPFGGSGTTLMACEASGRRCVTLELDPAYCDVIVQRFEEHTGIKAELVRAAE